jgi:hypothetical protein
MDEEARKPHNQPESSLRTPSVPIELIPAEVSFENIGYFTPSSKRIKNITTKEKTVAEKTNPDGTRTSLQIKIIGTGEYGLPTTVDLDYYRAFLRILDETVGQHDFIPEPISIPMKKLIRYTGKRVSGGEIREAKNWIRRCHYTGIQGFFYQADRRDYAEIGEEPLFPRYLFRGQKMSDGKVAETNYVWLASWFRSNYLHHHLRPIDLAFHRRLRKPIAKSLYPLLAIGWYAAGGGFYTKSYTDLCQEFLLIPHRYLSDIKRQLDPSHHELEREHFLKTWEYRKAIKGQDWIITYYPGEKFFEDQHARESRRQRAKQIANRSQPSVSPQLDLIDYSKHLLTEILEVCGDTRNKAVYQKIIRTHPEGLLWMALSETRQADRERRITKTKGAYFMEMVKQLAKLRTAGEEPWGVLTIGLGSFV